MTGVSSQERKKERHTWELEAKRIRKNTVGKQVRMKGIDYLRESGKFSFMRLHLSK